MSQNQVNYGIDPSGAQLLDELLSGEQQNRLTMDGGNTRPSYAMEGTVWTDKSVENFATLKRFDGTSDVVLMTINEQTGAITIPGIADTDLSNLSSTGKAYVAIKGYNNSTVYAQNDVVLTTSNGVVALYKSLVDNNTSALTDTTKWEEVSLGGGGAANTDLSNLTPTGENHFANPALTNSPYTTNRILEIPQDIKLDLNDGTLTLKAGSKVYVPNGFEQDGTTPKFDVVTIVNDLTTTGYQNDTIFVLYQTYPSEVITTIETSKCSTVSSQPSAGGVYYDRSVNQVYRIAGGVKDYIFGFPIAIADKTSGTITSIDPIFNGFGYIGSTVFALPGVKVQLPNGRNEDGTYRSIFRTLESVSIGDGFTNNSNALLYLSNDDLIVGKSSSGFNIHFDDKTGYLVRTDGVDTQKNGVIIADILSSTKISSFTPRNVDSVANSNASNFSKAGRSYLSGLSAPSTKYEDWTLLASNNNYTIPANGWLLFSKTATAAGQNILMFDPSSIRSYDLRYSTASSQNIGGSIRVAKGETVRVSYTAAGATQYFRFFYDVGEV